MQLLTATLTKPARQVTTKYGDRTVADVRLADGTEIALWRPANDQVLSSLTMGQTVTVAKDSKGKINLVDNAPTNAVVTTSPVPIEPTEINPDTKRAIAVYVEEQAKLFGFCLSQASTIQGIQPEDVRATATTLYIQTIKHFNL
ncbi:hypothetical protein IQ219_02485 [Synechocystis sp. LEGE 06083]|uniref:hypothetical protein n=1 Tax=Synechocystis sp. LEGE 06083 TaxID=915336 RepID=UPI00187FB002|nr:hypothetical protein [Synechocystis sp. LEGE 06083]MBE9194216.1 hypothetical protein [Synechocystis sp. LEGE 06083]